LRTIPAVRVDRLPEVLDFVDLLPTDRRARLLVDAIGVTQLVLATGIDHLHAHFLTVAAQTAHIVHLLTGVPYTVTAHAKDIYRSTVDWDLAARIASHAVALVTVCDANVRFLAARLPTTTTTTTTTTAATARVVRIYNGLGPQQPATSWQQRTPGLILGIGRLVEKKGFDRLLDAFALLAPRRPELRCVLIGDGEQRTRLEDQIRRLDIADRVEVMGAQPQQVVADWLRRAHVLVAPCQVGTDGNQDALPTVLLEALAAGLPTVATRVAGIPEIIEHGRQGLLVDGDDPATIASAVATILDDRCRWESMSTAGPQKLASRFDRETSIAQLLDTMAARHPVSCTTNADRPARALQTAPTALPHHRRPTVAAR
jgi:glycosyltransferase involved in cell wall biosynthesis